MRYKTPKDSINVRVSEKLKHELGEIAEQADRTLTEIVTIALEQWVRCYHAAEETNERLPTRSASSQAQQ